MATSPPLAAAPPPPTHHPPPPQQQHHHHHPSPSEHAHLQKASPSQPSQKLSILHQAPQHSPREHAQALPVQSPHQRVSSAPGVKHWEESPNQRPREINGMRHSNGPTNGQLYSPTQHHHTTTVNMDAVHRLQSQMSLNTASLETQRRDLQRMQDNWAHDIQRIDGTIARLGDEVRGVQAVLEQVRGELRQRPTHAPPPQSSSASDMAVELIRQNLESLRPKVVEIDDVKIQLEIMKGKLARLDNKGSQEPVHNGVPSFSSPREMPLHGAPNTLHSAPPPRVNTPGRPDGRPEIRPGPGPVYHPHHPHERSHPHQQQPPPPSQAQPPPQHSQHQQQQPSHPPQQAPHQSHPHPHPPPHTHPIAHPPPHVPAAQGHPPPPAHSQAPHHHQPPPPPPSHQGHLPSSDLSRLPEAERAAASQSSGWVSVNPSSKRGHTNGVDDRAEHQVHPSSPKRPRLAALEPRMDSNDSKGPPGLERMDTDERADSRAQSRDSYGETTATPSQFIPYHSGAGTPPDDSWRSEQRVLSQGHDARTSPRRGRGGGRGRGRKSLPAELSTPSWERTEWTSPQMAPDGYYHESPSGAHHGVFARRDSNGSLVGIPPGHVSMDRMQDPYAHTKKTRTKPIRNADGVLIRKDGRPDMRSQSSAANLRKVHARKEQEKGMDGVHPAHSSSLAHVAAHMMDTPSPAPTSEGNSDHNVHERHSQIMEKVFPHGHDDPFRGPERYARQEESPRQRKAVKGEANGSANPSASPPEAMETEPSQEQTAAVEDKTMEDTPEVSKAAVEGAPKADGDAASAIGKEASKVMEEAPKVAIEA